MDITEVSILHHIGIVLLLLWILSSFGVLHPLLYFASFIYLFRVNEHYTLKLRRRVHFEERKQANQRRVLSDFESVRWLNHAVEKIWPICMEQIASQKILLPIVPWFLDKYKPWTVEEAVVQHLYLGRNAPMFTEMRVLQDCDDDHLVLELGMNFLTADDMSTILAVKLRKSLGFGIWTKMHVTGMHIEGRVLVGVKFLRHWPFLGRLRLCFAEPPYFRMMAKPFFSHGLDVTEIPGIAGWLDKLLAVAFKQTLVEPNMLVVDVEKFASTPKETWFTVDEKRPVAYAIVEIVEAVDMRPADLNGLADPYVKVQLGTYEYRTEIQKKTLAPKWQAEFKIPIHSWESPNVLFLEVLDKDHFVDDTLGDCSVNINDLRDGQRHGRWLPLQNVKMGRLHLAVTVLEDDGKEGEQFEQEEGHPNVKDLPNEKENANERESESAQQNSRQLASKMADEFEPIDIEGQQQTGIWIHHPGSNISQRWEPRKREGKRTEVEILREDNDNMNSPGSTAAGSGHCDSSSESENPAINRLRPLDTIKKGLKRIGSVFKRSLRNVESPGNESPKNKGEAVLSSHINVRATGEKEVGVTLILDNDYSGAVSDQKSHKESSKEEIDAKSLLGDDNSGVVQDQKSDKESGKKEMDVSFVLDDNNAEAVLDQKSEEILVPEKGNAVDPSKGHIRGMTKSILKHAGRSAHSLKHALSHKDSCESKGCPGPSAVSTAEVSLGCDSSIREFLPSLKEYSPTKEEALLESSSVVGSGKESHSAKEENVKPISSVSSGVIKEFIDRTVSLQGEETSPNLTGNGEPQTRILSSGDAKRIDDDVAKAMEIS